MNPFAQLAMMEKLSDQELAQIAAAPAQPGMQLPAIQELDKRKQMRMGSAQAPKTTVLEDRVAQSMQPPQTGGAGPNPIMAGAANIMAQQAQAQPQGFARGGLASCVQHFDQGGAVRMDPYQRNAYNDVATALTTVPGLFELSPEDAMRQAKQFQGPDMLAPFAERLSAREREMNAQHNRDRWMAVARAAFEGMNSPSFMSGVGRIGSGIASGISGVDSDYRNQEDALMQRQMGLASAQQGRMDTRNNAAYQAFMGRQGAGLDAAMGVASSAGHARESAADRSVQNAQLQMYNNLIEATAQQLYRERRVQSLSRAPFNDPGDYTMADARREAAVMVGMGRGRSGSSPDDLNERLRAALFAADPMNNFPPEAQQRARGIVDSILSGNLGNAGTSTHGQGDATITTPAPSGQTAAERAQVPLQRDTMRDFQQGRRIPQPNTVYPMDERGNVIFPE